MNEYVCTVCSRAFLKERRLRKDAVPRCDPCLDAFHREAKRLTWQRHGAAYRETQKAKPKDQPKTKPVVATAIPSPVDNQELVPSPEGGRLVDWLLPNGHKVVWMGYS